MKLKPVQCQEIAENPFHLIGSVWMLITAGGEGNFNTMTASWGGLGVLWNKTVSYVFVRPTRYTYEFMERNDTYSLSFFGEEHRKALNYCGSHSGRDVDKVKNTGLVPVPDASGVVYFEDARLVMICRKLYHQDIDPSLFHDPSIDNNYPAKDYHRMYIGEIISTYRS